MAWTALRHATAEGDLSDQSSREALASLRDAREGTLALVGHLSEEQLTSVHSPIMSPLVWDLAHIAAYEDLWLVHRHGGLELSRPDLADVYDAFETPRQIRGEIELLGPREARAYLEEVRARAVEALARMGAGDGAICELVVRHELQHQETMRQTMALAGLLPAGEPPVTTFGPGTDDDRKMGVAERGHEMHATQAERRQEWATTAAGPFQMGAPPEGFAYDNERPRHAVELASFQIAKRPVTNASWLSFSEGGGYERREWWSDEGWAWKQEHDVSPDPRVATGHASAPVCHVSWFEADAYARALGARLPSEAEWEKAAARGALEDVGWVWEWTSSRFGPYPGFVAHPYREYSEVFFGGDYRVLRGGSWATSRRVATLTFRNWDHPIRRQIFAGLRLAKDV
jgi:iron(II)-dependent oxidoreductase